MIKSALGRLYIAGGALALPPSAISTWLPFSLRLLKAARPAQFAHGKAALSELMRGAMPAWQRRVADLGRPDLLRQDGHFVVWESPESARSKLAGWQATDTGSATFRVASTEELAALRQLSKRPVAGAIRFDNTGQIADNAELLRCMEDAFLTRGGEIVFDRAERLALQGNVASAILASGQALGADRIVVSAGFWSGDLLRPLGLKVPIAAERGYHIQDTQAAWPEGMPPVVFEDRSMIVTGFSSGVRAASFVEIARPDTPPDAGKWGRLKKHVSELGLPLNADSAAEWMGIRPTLPDYLPAIGKVQNLANLYYAFGHQHLGLTLGPVTGEMVADMLVDGGEPKAFSLDRFQE
jgi:D-amino-acid dehydrogenase